MTIYRFLAIVTVAMAVQYMYPALLLSGVAIALAVILMYFTIQNPDTMLDVTTGAFTSEAMITFLHDRQQEKQKVQLVGVKINNIDRINQLMGIENGSILLAQVSRFLRDGTGAPWVFRMRGACFVAVTGKAEDHRRLSEEVNSRIRQPWNVGGTDIMLRATVCCVASEELTGAPISPEEAVNYLETAFLQNRHTSRRINTVVIGVDFLEKMKRSRAVEAALRKALEDGEGLELYYQPLWSVKEERFSGAEVLLRFNHPTLGFIPPDEFVPIAESCGLITAMDELVVRKACSFIRDNDPRRELGLERLEINLSALEFMHRRLPALLKEIMEQYQVDPSFLYFEITETAATESFELLRECMHELCQAGCRFALDDFGTGYANISQVIKLPFSMVKLDKSLLLGPETVLEDIAHMFARIDCVTVIEGVETEEQAALVKTIDVDHVQGYYYAKPMSGRGLISFLRTAAKCRVK